MVRRPLREGLAIGMLDGTGWYGEGELLMVEVICGKLTGWMKPQMTSVLYVLVREAEMRGAILYVRGLVGTETPCRKCAEALARLEDGVPQVASRRLPSGHAYACHAVARHWLVGRKLCEGDAGRPYLVAAMSELRRIGPEAAAMLDAFMALLALSGRRVT